MKNPESLQTFVELIYTGKTALANPKDYEDLMRLSNFLGMGILRYKPLLQMKSDTEEFKRELADIDGSEDRDFLYDLEGMKEDMEEDVFETAIRKCPVKGCSKTFIHRDTVALHFLRHYQEDLENAYGVDKTSSDCPICAKEFSHVKILTHVFIEHESEQRLLTEVEGYKEFVGLIKRFSKKGTTILPKRQIDLEVHRDEESQNYISNSEINKSNSEDSIFDQVLEDKLEEEYFDQKTNKDFSCPKIGCGRDDITKRAELAQHFITHYKKEIETAYSLQFSARACPIANCAKKYAVYQRVLVHVLLHHEPTLARLKLIIREYTSFGNLFNLDDLSQRYLKEIKKIEKDMATPPKIMRKTSFSSDLEVKQNFDSKTERTQMNMLNSKSNIFEEVPHTGETNTDHYEEYSEPKNKTVKKFMCHKSGCGRNDFTKRELFAQHFITHFKLQIENAYNLDFSARTCPITKCSKNYSGYQRVLIHILLHHEPILQRLKLTVKEYSSFADLFNLEDLSKRHLQAIRQIEKEYKEISTTPKRKFSKSSDTDNNSETATMPMTN